MDTVPEMGPFAIALGTQWDDLSVHPNGVVGVDAADATNAKHHDLIEGHVSLLGASRPTERAKARA